MPSLLKIQSLFQGTAIIFLTQNVSLNKPDNKGREVFILKNFCFSIVASCSFISRETTNWAWKSLVFSFWLTLGTFPIQVRGAAAPRSHCTWLSGGKVVFSDGVGLKPRTSSIRRDALSTPPFPPGQVNRLFYISACRHFCVTFEKLTDRDDVAGSDPCISPLLHRHWRGCLLNAHSWMRIIKSLSSQNPPQYPSTKKRVVKSGYLLLA